MKKIKLIFGLLLVAGFFAAIALSSTNLDNTAIKKRGQMYLPTKG